MGFHIDFNSIKLAANQIILVNPRVQSSIGKPPDPELPLSNILNGVFN